MLNPTIGLEIHVQLKTKEKLFSSSQNLFGQSPNSLVTEFDVALPGTLPVLNEEAVNLAIAFGLSVNAKINKNSFFDRKHYFYPDSPSGFQITQSFSPIVLGGSVVAKVNHEKKEFKIHHTHLETDAGKSMHKDEISLIDYNRVGTPLIEIVSEPCMKSVEEAVAYAKAVYQIVCYYNICDGNLQEGSFRMDANISLSPNKSLGTRCEIKNLNSFKYLKDALNYEIERQREILESGKEIVQQTRLFEVESGKTFAMRDKENAEDYRYFTEPDLLSVVLTDTKINTISDGMGIHLDKLKELLFSFDLKDEVVENLISEKGLLDYCLSFSKESGFNKEWFKALAFFIPEIISRNKLEFQLPDKDKVLTILLAKNNGLNSLHVRGLLEKLILKHDFDLNVEIKSYLISEDDLSSVVDKILNEFTKEVLEYKSGKTKVLGFLMGRIMKVGKYNPDNVKKMLEEKLQ